MVLSLLLMSSKVYISYKTLRKINPEAARTAVLEYLSSNGGNVAEVSRTFGVQRLTIYNIIKRSSGDLQDKPRTPHRIANKTRPDVEQKVLESATKTGLGAKRLQKFLYEHYQIEIAYGTLRGILRRSKS